MLVSCAGRRLSFGDFDWWQADVLSCSPIFLHLARSSGIAKLRRSSSREFDRTLPGEAGRERRVVRLADPEADMSFRAFATRLGAWRGAPGSHGCLWIGEAAGPRQARVYMLPKSGITDGIAPVDQLFL